MKTYVATLAVLAASMAATSRASSDMVSHIEAIPSFSVPGSVDVELPLFDASLGTLTSVSLALVGNGEVDYDVLDDFGNDGGVVTATMFGEFTALLGSNELGNTWILSGNDSYSSTGFFAAPVNGNTADSTSDPGTVSSFVATGPGQMFTTEILLDGTDAFTSDLNDDFISLGGNLNVGQITVVYEFTPVPEPGTSAFLSLVSVGLSLVRHRRI